MSSQQLPSVSEESDGQHHLMRALGCPQITVPASRYLPDFDDPKHNEEAFDNPFEKLPLEIFTEIVKTSVRMSYATPFTFSHVCKQWKNAVDNSPYVWDVLVLTRRRPFDKTKMWLKKSKGRLWELTVRASALDHSSESQRWQDKLKKELKWAHLRVLKSERWRPYLYFDHQGKWDALTSLETLEIGDNNPLSSYAKLLPNTVNTLRRLSVTSVGHQKPLEYVSLIINLTSLILNNVYIETHLSRLFGSNPRLEHLSFQNVSARTKRKYAEIFSLSYLKSLQIVGDFPMHYFSDVDLPALKVLRVDQWHARSLHSFTTKFSIRYHANLSEISVRSCYNFKPHFLLPLLQHCPNLHKLEIVKMCSNVSWSLCDLLPVVKALAIIGCSFDPASDSGFYYRQLNPAKQPLCPKLTDIDFSGCACFRSRPRALQVSRPLP